MGFHSSPPVDTLPLPDTPDSDEDEDPDDYDSDRCTDDQFTCKNSDCIPVRLRCNGNKDCRDGSDEFECEFKKSSGD